MGKHVRIAGAALLSLATMGTTVSARGTDGPGTPPRRIAELTQRTTRHAGLLTVHVDHAAGKIWLELPAPSARGGEVGRFLLVEGLVAGVGSNPVGLDRGQLGPSRVVVLRRLGGRVLIQGLNLRFRALDAPTAERRAVEESFASSVLWGAPVAALEPDGRALVDLTPFLLRDAHGVRRRLAAAGQGKFDLDRERSAVDLDAFLAFPDNLEFEAWLTYAGEDPGAELRAVTPDPEAVTLVQHVSLVRLPEPGYRPRRFDPRAGSFHVGFQDYAAPLDAPLDTRWIVRHRLHRTDPARERSSAVRPIVYHVDPAIPEPVRSAVLDGARWWAKAFEAAGFVDAFRVEMLPQDAHPLDVRYHVIEWVHRATRGWSYGGGVVDPRTGEMIKAHVSLGSLRVRQDRLLFEGLLGTVSTGSGGADDPLQLALARIRQLVAHEVGHTLGLAHNFAASTYGDRASVMDYPAPLIEIDESGRLDTRRAYGIGVGSWDIHAVRYAYGEFPPGVDEASGLQALVRDGLRQGELFLTDQDARAPGAAHPRASLWDNGADPVAALRTTLRVREIALARFGEHNVAVGQPWALLEEVLATVYFHHRYQVEATAKLLGGVDYRHALRGDGQPPPAPVPAAAQRAALAALLATLDRAALDIGDEVVRRVLPRPPGYTSNREQFTGHTAPLFDPLAAAATAADLAVQALLQPERCARLVRQHLRDPQLPALEEVLDALVDTAFTHGSQAEPSRRDELARTVERVVVVGLIRLATEAATGPEVRSRADGALARLLPRIAAAEGDATEVAHRADLERHIRRHLDRPATAAAPAAAAGPLPPGSPIGIPAAGIGCSWSGPTP